MLSRRAVSQTVRPHKSQMRWICSQRCDGPTSAFPAARSRLDDHKPHPSVHRHDPDAAARHCLFLICRRAAAAKRRGRQSIARTSCSFSCHLHAPIIIRSRCRGLATIIYPEPAADLRARRYAGHSSSVMSFEPTRRWQRWRSILAVCSHFIRLRAADAGERPHRVPCCRAANGPKSSILWRFTGVNRMPSS